MGARGIYQAQECHFVNLIPPIDVNGGLTSEAFNLKDYAHATIVLQFGAISGTPAKVSLESSDEGSPESTTALPFNVHKCEVEGGDVLGPRVAATAAAGFVPADVDDIFYVIELDANVLPADQPFVRLVVGTPGATCLASAVAILSGARYGHDESETVLT